MPLFKRYKNIYSQREFVLHKSKIYAYVRRIECAIICVVLRRPSPSNYAWNEDFMVIEYVGGGGGLTASDSLALAAAVGHNYIVMGTVRFGSFGGDGSDR